MPSAISPLPVLCLSKLVRKEWLLALKIMIIIHLFKIVLKFKIATERKLKILSEMVKGFSIATGHLLTLRGIWMIFQLIIEAII